MRWSSSFCFYTVRAAKPCHWKMQPKTKIFNSVMILKHMEAKSHWRCHWALCFAVLCPCRRNIEQRASAGSTSTTLTTPAALTWSARSPRRCSTCWTKSASESVWLPVRPVQFFGNSETPLNFPPLINHQDTFGRLKMNWQTWWQFDG